MSRILVITGASRGIGRATAHHFAERGFTVINLSRRAPDLPDVHHLPTDLGNPDWPARLKDPLAAALEGATQVVLVHNAGAITKDSIADVDPARLRALMEVNVIAPAVLTRMMLPMMPAGSSVIYIGSTLSEMAVANSCSYVTSKHALLGLMRATCQDLSGRAIHTACVCPGFTDTAMLREHVGHSDDVLTTLAGNVAQGRLASPEEIARTIAFCAENAVLNGAVIHANLGQINR